MAHLPTDRKTHKVQPGELTVQLISYHPGTDTICAADNMDPGTVIARASTREAAERTAPIRP